MWEIGRGQITWSTSLAWWRCCLLWRHLPTGFISVEWRKSLWKVLCRTCMLPAAAHLHNLDGVELTETIDFIVTCDGTWCKCGFTATHGVVVVIAWEPGKVLDFIIMTKHCSICARKKTALREDSQEFADWWEEHNDSCEINHLGSSPVMECAGALEIWKWSEELHRLRYVEVICDGDAKTFATLNDHTKRAQTRESEVAKRQRKLKPIVEKHVEAVHVVAEGTLYEAGGFECWLQNP